MAKRFLFRLLSSAIVLAALVLYLLAEFKVVKLPVKYNIWFFFFLLMAGFGVLNLISGIFRADKRNLYAAATLLSGSLIYLNIEFFKYKTIILVVACVALFAAMHFLHVLLSGGAETLTADNEKVGYKNYEKRLEDKEKEEERTEEKIQKDIKKGKTEEIKIKSFKD